MSLAISGDSPNFTNASLTTPTITSPTITGAVVSSMASSVLTSGTSVTASGTSIDFTSIPSWVKRITVMFYGTSTSGTSNVQVRLGTASGIVSTGYSGIVSEVQVGAGVNATTWTGTGAEITRSTPSSSTFNGQVTLLNITGNNWVITGLNGYSNSNYQSTGNVSLSGTLDRVRITTVNGTDTFDAGSFNVMYEQLWLLLLPSSYRLRQLRTLRRRNTRRQQA